MAVAPVSLGPSSRAWFLAGLSHLLFDGPVNLAALERQDLPRGGALLPRPGLPASFGRSGEETASSGAAHNAATVAVALPSAPSALPSAPGLPVLAPYAAVPQDPQLWPEPWAGCFAKAVPAPVLWTYHTLGADLTGRGRSPERSAFLKSLIAELRLPRGSSVFWPCALPGVPAEDTDALRADAALFAAGVARLSPRVLVVFGETALADMGLAGTLGYFRQTMIEGKILVFLPDIDDLLQGAAQRSSAISLLRALFGSLSL